MVRGLLVIVLGLLLAVQIVRNAAVAALAPLQPTVAAELWASHPSVEIALALAQIGSAARDHAPIDRHSFEIIDDAAVKSPLASEPFLVHGVREEMAGNSETAKLAFLAAQWRDPRSLPAAYFLADYFFRAGNMLEGLKQAALLAKLSPNGNETVAPFIAAYAQSRANWRQIRALFQSQEGLEDGVLVVLAHDARNADAILTLADARHRRPDSIWLPILLSSLIEKGDYDRARRIWSRIGLGRANSDLIYDSAFSDWVPPPPFNWTLTTSTVGLAERQPGKRLHVIFYGNEDGTLASELLMLAPGKYRLEMQLAGTPMHSEALSWSVRCDKSDSPVSTIGIVQAAKTGWEFDVPTECRAQWLELSGRSGDVAQQSEATINGLTLTRTGPNA